MDNWLYKLASGSVYQTGSSDLSWEDTQLTDFSVEIYLDKTRMRVSKDKHLSPKEIIYPMIKSSVPGPWTSGKSHPNYDILTCTFLKTRPVDIKFQLDALSSMESFSKVKVIKLDWDRSISGI